MRVVILGVLVILVFSGCNSIDDGGNETFIDYSRPRQGENNSNPKTPLSSPNYPNSTLPPSPYLIGAWNIQTFGKTKAENKILMPIIIDIIDDYDIIGIQEIRDNTYTVNDMLQDIPSSTAVFSPRLGRTDYKEQYAFIYSDRVSLLKTMTYPDNEDIFEREPFIGHFRAGSYTFALILVHTQPTNTPTEIKALSDVVSYTKKQFNENDIYIIGDLNMACSYIDDSFTIDYHLLIDNDTDTTTGRSDCAYDRILVVEPYENIINSGVDNITEETKGNLELIQALSDHFPIYMTFAL